MKKLRKEYKTFILSYNDRTVILSTEKIVKAILIENPQQVLIRKITY